MITMIFTHHPRSRFERRMHRRRAHRERRARERKQPFPSLRRPIAHRTARRRMRQGWSSYVVHGPACGPALLD